MLDVHPPEHAAHSWRDFFIHIATIVVGLLIAIGLEQIVEHVHQHYELREAREAIQREFESNRKQMAIREEDWLATAAELKNNVLVLGYIRQHPGTPQTKLPGDIEWEQAPFVYDHAAWDAAEKNGIIRLMAQNEANHDQEFYALMQAMAAQSVDVWNAINDATRYDLSDTDPTHLTPSQLEKVTELNEIALEKHIEMGYSFGRLAHEYPEMPQAITWVSINRIRPRAIDIDPQGLAAAHQLSVDRVHAAVRAAR